MFPSMGGFISISAVQNSPQMVSVPGSEEALKLIALQWIRLDDDYKAKVESAHASWMKLELPPDTGIRAIAMTRTTNAETALIDTQTETNQRIQAYDYFALPSFIYQITENPSLQTSLNVVYGTIMSPLYSLLPTMRIDGELLAHATDVPAPPVLARPDTGILG